MLSLRYRMNRPIGTMRANRTIYVTQLTKDKLDQTKIRKRDTYDDIINRLFSKYMERIGNQIITEDEYYGRQPGSDSESNWW